MEMDVQRVLKTGIGRINAVVQEGLSFGAIKTMGAVVGAAGHLSATEQVV